MNADAIARMQDGDAPSAYRTTLVGLQQPWPLSFAFAGLNALAAAALGHVAVALVWAAACLVLDVGVQALLRRWLPGAESADQGRGLTRLAILSFVRTAIWMSATVYVAWRSATPAAYGFLAISVATFAATAGAVGWMSRRVFAATAAPAVLSVALVVAGGGATGLAGVGLASSLLSFALACALIAIATRRLIAGAAAARMESNVALRELRVALERSEAAELRADSANRSKSQFLANMSHEIRTPMNGILGMNELLLRTSLAPEQRRFAQTVRSSAEALLGVIDDILDISKLEAGKVSIETIDFSMAALAGQVAELFEPRAAEKGLSLRCYVEPAAQGYFKGDPTRVRQVLANLVSNAVKFTERGHVSIRIGAEPCDVGALLRVEVEDTGIGVADDQLARLFQSFEQADSSITRRFGGTGLGLAISRHLLELMGGRIGVANRPERGAVFWFELELEAGREPQALAEPPPTVPQAWQARVLLAEDNDINALLATEILRQAGLEAHRVADGAQALAAVATGAYDVVLMDVQMPVMDGLEATRRIRALPGAPGRVAIIALTANAMKGDEEACREAGMNDFVSKPFKPDHFVAALIRVLLLAAVTSEQVA